MKTAAINFKAFIPGIKTSRVSFKGFPFIKPLKEDSFELSSGIQKVKIKDISGRDKEAVIAESGAEECTQGDNVLKFTLSADGKTIGYAVVKNNRSKDTLNLFHLYTEEHEKRNYKGAGTELLKCAVKESFKRGYNGRLRLYASHAEYSPLVFYYKNNFIVEKPLNKYDQTHSINPAIHYAAINNIPVHKVLPYSCSQSFMYLDENAAQAFLEGRKLYANRSFEEKAGKNIDNHDCRAYLAQSPYKNEFFILVTDENAEYNKAKFVITLDEKENAEGIKHFEIKDMFNFGEGNKQHSAFALDTLNKISKESGYEKASISPNLGIDASLWLD